MAEGRNPKTTIADVARVAGVSVTTVSRVLNGEKYVREDKKKAVERAVAKLDYQPNLYARSLAGDKSYLIGLLFDDPRGDYLSGMQRGAMQKCREEGYHVVVELFDRSTTLDQIDQFLSKLRPSGVLLTPPVCDNKIILAALARKGIPAVRISPSEGFPGMASVKIDDYHAARQMTEHLISLGHKDIGFIIGDIEHADARARLRAFRDAMRDAGLRVVEDWIAQGTYQFSSGLDAAAQILSHEKKPSAIFASNDDMAAATIVVADGMGLHVPEDLSVAGFDDIPLASAVSPALTTIRQPVEDMAVTAVGRLMDMLRGGDSDVNEPAFLDVEFIKRASTGPKN
ncbi:LacI family DNA-binding transcriptional regulator [Kordiimonas aestuarii]|uniref:LacI family DNA-binding transcriptional regulator n=1 Tax=Kordiimonas aestuarii TaxID=1005925 RepID=UPI0021D1F1B6|nr:LacI family DNA-binding transcriptional regulator [Kordiimonas aestuarii]